MRRANDKPERLEGERSLVSDAGHELRTPLAILKTELELALRQPRLAPAVEQALRSAVAETDRLCLLVDNLLVLAQADGGLLPMRREQIGALDLFGHLAQRYSVRFVGAQRRMELVASPSLELAADPLRLEQALGNLVENALRHGRGSTRLSARARNGLVELHVVDEGPGFPPAFLPHAFARFSRADSARSRGGAGLGLAIVDAIAQAHGGAAYARNRDEGGADVWLSVSSTALPTLRSRRS
jgi:signal transduction histidine kinase